MFGLRQFLSVVVVLVWPAAGFSGQGFVPAGRPRAGLLGAIPDRPQPDSSASRVNRFRTIASSSAAARAGARPVAAGERAHCPRFPLAHPGQRKEVALAAGGSSSRPGSRSKWSSPAA